MQCRVVKLDHLFMNTTDQLNQFWQQILTNYTTYLGQGYVFSRKPKDNFFFDNKEEQPFQFVSIEQNIIH